MIRESNSGLGLNGAEAKPGISGPVEVLVKTKWCRANASVLGLHFGISILVTIIVIIT
jgi:hypothetical protein